MISMIKERPGRVIGVSIITYDTKDDTNTIFQHATSHKEDLSFGHRATVLAIASRKRA